MRTILNPPAALRDAALLVARLVLGTILIAHGWQKFATWGLDGTSAAFTQMGVPAAGFSAAIAATIELLGGIALLLGLLTPVVGLLVALNMAGAFFFAHTGHGIFIKDGGWELVGAIGAAALALAGAGAGRFSLDALLNRSGATTVAVERDERTLVNA